MIGKTKREAIYKAYKEQTPMSEMCEMFGMSEEEITRQIWVCEGNEERKSNKWEEKRLRIIRLRQEGKSVDEICREAHANKQTVVKTLKANGYTIDRKPRTNNYPERDERAKAEYADFQNGMNVNELSEKYGVTQKIIRYDLTLHGVDFQADVHTKEIIQEALKSDRHRGWQSELAEKYGLTRQRISKLLKDNGII